MVADPLAALLERASAALGSTERTLLAMRCGYHVDILAVALAGTLSGRIIEQYTLLRSAHRQPDGPDPDVATLVATLQHATQPFVRSAPEIAAQATQIEREVLTALLDEWVGAAGVDTVSALDDTSFSTELQRRILSPSSAVVRVHPTILSWLDRVSGEAIATAGIAARSLDDLEHLLGLRPSDAADYARLLASTAPIPPRRTQALFRDGLAEIPTNRAAWALVAAIHDAILGRNWNTPDDRQVPEHRTVGPGGRGELRVSLRSNGDLDTLWERVSQLDDLTSDTLLVCLAAWTAAGGSADQPVWVSADTILDARGIKRIRRSHEPKNWQHGHRREDRLAVGRALAQLDQLWLELSDIELGRPGSDSRRILNVSSRAMTVLERVSERDQQHGEVLLAARVLPGGWARVWTEAGVRQVGLIAQAALSYDPYRAAVEKRLAKYFAFSFRWNAHKRGEPLVRSVDTLLERGGLPPDPARPQRYRNRLERALNRLRSDTVIAEWSYIGDPADLPARHWLASWQTMRIIIHPPHDIVLGNARLRRAGAPRALTPEQ